jgi:hypothetical protein
MCAFAMPELWFNLIKVVRNQSKIIEFILTLLKQKDAHEIVCNIINAEYIKY